MDTPLLTTKLYIPPLRPRVVSRPRLIERLNAGLHRKLTLISAPAGFGKTTLLSEWVHNCQRSAVWLSLDEGDNDPSRFLAYLFAAMQRVDTAFGQDTQAALQSPRPPLMDPLLTELINQVSIRDDGILLVLDDYHLVTAQPIHQALTFLLDHLPANMHLVIATRADPPLPIARLRGSGQMTELRQTDLRFTPDEVSTFLNQIMHLELSTADVSALASRTEGWVTGLHMAALSVRGRRRTQDLSSVSAFIQAFTGSHRFILDYLVEEVLDQQIPAIQDFLLKTSILDRLSGPLCDAVVDSEPAQTHPPIADIQAPLSGLDSPSQQTLEQLEAANLFIVPLDDERRWYRYHRLFADLLHQRLYQTYPALARTLHRRASRWYERHGLITAAIDHALSAKDFERAAQLVEQTAEATLMRSEVATFQRWMDRLPEELVRSHPSLCVFHAWTLLMRGRSLEHIETRLQDLLEDSEPMIGHVAAFRGFAALFQGQVSRAVELCQQALERLPEDSLFSRTMVTWMLSLTLLADSDHQASSQALNDLVRIGQESGNLLVAVSSVCHLAKLHVRQGQLHQAKAVYERALALATDTQGQLLPIASEPLFGLGELARQWNELEKATDYLLEGIELSEKWNRASALDAYIPLVRIKQAQGDVRGAHDALEVARQLALESESTELDDLAVALEQARLWVAQGETVAAERWLEERGIELSTLFPPLDASPGATHGLNKEAILSALSEEGDFVAYHFCKYEYLVLSQLLLSQNRAAEALALLEVLLPVIETRRRNDLLIKIQVLKALAFQQQDSIPEAMHALESALSLAQPGGHVSIFTDEGEPMATLLRHAAVRGIRPPYVGKLLAALDPSAEGRDQQAAGHPQPGTQPLFEPISDRELEVLRLLGAGLSNPEIAGELIISVHTVRSHVKNIYGKLHVHKRWDAVQRAKELGLL